MANYAPQTVEANLASVIMLKNNFYAYMNYYFNQCRYINWKYSNMWNYNLNVNNGGICSTVEIEMGALAYSIYGFANNLYQSISHGLDCWNLTRKKIRAGVTDKNYDRLIKILSEEEYIAKNEEMTLLNFRKSRNFSTHNGRITFMEYIFQNGNLIYNLLELIGNLLKNIAVIDITQYQQGLESQMCFMEELRDTLLEYASDNNLVM